MKINMGRGDRGDPTIVLLCFLVVAFVMIMIIMQHNEVMRLKANTKASTTGYNNALGQPCLLNKIPSGMHLEVVGVYPCDIGEYVVARVGTNQLPWLMWVDQKGVTNGHYYSNGAKLVSLSGQ